MASIGSIGEFKPAQAAEWEVYSQRLKFFLEANGITDDARKRATFLSVCGSATFEIARSLCSPNGLQDTTFERILTLLTDHFTPKPSEIVQRFMFHKRDQREGEGITSYLAELRKIAEGCNFEANLEVMLRDRLVCGIRDEAAQRKMLAESQLTFKKAYDIILAAETTAQQVSELRTTSFKTNEQTQQAAVNQVKNQKFKTLDKTKRKNGCYRCGEQHEAKACRYKDSECHYCKKKGHLQKMCFQKNKPKQEQKTAVIKTLEEHQTIDNSTEDENIFTIQRSASQSPFIVTVDLDGSENVFEVDSGASYSVMSNSTFRRIWPNPNKSPLVSDCPVKFRDYQKNKIETEGICTVKVKLNNKKASLPLVITKGNCASLLGRNWFEPLGIALELNTITSHDSPKLVEEFAEVFDGKLGSYNGQTVKLEVDPTIAPIALKARNVAYAIRSRVEDEINRLQKLGVLKPIENPQWVTPVVPVVKPDNTIRLCADYKCTINKALRKDPYPMPTVAEIIRNLNGATVFAKLDMAQAYLQLHVDEESAKVQSIITHTGTYSVHRLQFGVSVAPQVFQRMISNRVRGIPGVFPYFDDILVSARSEAELNERLRLVLQRLAADGLKLKKEKCIFMTDNIEFLGYRIDKSGIRPSADKVKSITSAPKPKCKRELQSFLGLLNFYHDFLKGKAEIAEPLYRLLDDKAEWSWTSKQDKAFTGLKNLLSSEPLMVHYDSNKQLRLVCDASPWGIGAVLCHVLPSGQEAPIAYYSHTLNKTERNYAQIDREALAIVVAVRKFHYFVYGRDFEIVTDHKPLLGILKEDKPTPELVSPRMARWSLFLSNYNYYLKHVPGKEIGNADALSRFPDVNAEPGEHEDVQDVLMMENLPEVPLKADVLAKWTARDPILGRVLDYVRTGWPHDLEDGFAPFTKRKYELSTYRGCLLWGRRVVIPGRCKEQILRILHSTHIGMVRMKTLARSYVWWPRIDEDIEMTIRVCNTCQTVSKMPAHAPIHPWEWSTRPWSRLHVDFAGPFKGSIYFLVVDSYSKWLEVERVPSTSAAAAIKTLRRLFATHGLPDVVVSDNGSAFIAEEFRKFLRQNGIRQATTAPYHPASNGQAERMVQEMKRTLSRLGEGEDDVKLARFLLSQHTTPSTVTGSSPAEILLNRKLKTCLDLLHPNFYEEMKTKQEVATTSRREPRQFHPHEDVWVKVPLQKNAWTPAQVVDRTGPISYEVEDKNGKRHKHHVDQLRKKAVPESQQNQEDADIVNPLPTSCDDKTTTNSPRAKTTPGITPSRPRRVRKLPTRLQDYIVTSSDGGEVSCPGVGNTENK